MKFSKNIFGLFVGAVVVAATVLPVKAQNPGVYYNYTTNATPVSFAGSNTTTNALGTAATNVLKSFACSEYVAFQSVFTFKAMASATSTVQIFGYRSLDGSTFETTPSTSTLVTLNGTTAVTTILDITNLYGTASYKWVMGNTNASVAVTNIASQNRFKAPLQSTRPRG